MTPRIHHECPGSTKHRLRTHTIEGCTSEVEDGLGALEGTGEGRGNGKGEECLRLRPPGPSLLPRPLPMCLLKVKVGASSLGPSPHSS